MNRDEAKDKGCVEKADMRPGNPQGAHTVWIALPHFERGMRFSSSLSKTIF